MSVPGLPHSQKGWIFRSGRTDRPILMVSSAPQAIRHSAAESAASLARTANVASSIDRLWVVWGEPDDRTRRVIGELWRDVEFIVVGGMAAVLQGAPVHTIDLDIVYSTTAPSIY